MTRVNEQGYLEKRSMGSGKPKGGSSRAKWRNWWLIPATHNGKDILYGYACLGLLKLPKEYIGKRVRFKIEVIE